MDSEAHCCILRTYSGSVYAIVRAGGATWLRARSVPSTQAAPIDEEGWHRLTSVTPEPPVGTCILLAGETLPGGGPAMEGLRLTSMIVRCVNLGRAQLDELTRLKGWPGRPPEI